MAILNGQNWLICKKMYHLALLSFLRFECFYNRIESETVRVKKLDAEDITKLGWERSSTEAQIYSIGDFALAVMEDGSIGIAESIENHWVSAFRGEIANKSVLKQLMVMVGITKE